MDKCICDICDKNVASRQFKAKEKVKIPILKHGMVIPKNTWVKIDICEECYDKLFKNRKGKN